jgi:predicted transcriptional regulator YheO
MRRELTLENVARIANGLTAIFGPWCEVVVHDLAQPQSSIVHITGNVTDRRIGGPLTDFVLGLLRRERKPDDMYGYVVRTHDGRILKSSTIFIRNENGFPIAVFCINVDISPLIAADQQLAELLSLDTSVEVDKHFAADVPHLLQGMIQSSLESVLNNSTIVEDGDLTTQQRKAIVADLERQGAFKIRNAVPMVAELFGVSRSTVYNYLKPQNRE